MTATQEQAEYVHRCYTAYKSRTSRRTCKGCHLDLYCPAQLDWLGFFGVDTKQLAMDFFDKDLPLFSGTPITVTIAGPKPKPSPDVQLELDLDPQTEQEPAK